MNKEHLFTKSKRLFLKYYFLASAFIKQDKRSQKQHKISQGNEKKILKEIKKKISD